MRILRLRRGILLCTLAVCLGCSAQTTERGDDSIRPAASLPKTTPWDLEALSKAPSVKWLNQKGKIRSLLYQGLPYKGKPTSVFAFYATPGSISGDPSKDKDLPAIVLAHGGRGRAYQEWVYLWAKRGYAAIAMDLSVRGADLDMEQIGIITTDTLERVPRKRLVDGGPDQSDEVKFGQLDAPVGDQWTYHAVANVILAHSLIRSFKDVDANRTAIEGISWGGYVALIAASLDNRFKAVVNVHGSGFLHENSYWKDWFKEKMTPEQREKWIQLWDPAMYTDAIIVPMLFITGVKDQFYPFDSFVKTYQCLKGERNLCLIIRSPVPHGHYFIFRGMQPPVEIKLFVDQYLKDGIKLPKINAVQVSNNKVVAEMATKTKLTAANMAFTTDTGKISERRWQSKPATINGNNIIAEAPPKDATAWFITVTDERGAVVSSEPVFADKTI